MKKKFRNINVNGKQYAYAIGKPNCDGDYNNCITIWLNKKLIYQEVISHRIIVTPKFITHFINLFLK